MCSRRSRTLVEAGLDIVTEQELDAIEARAKKASGWHNDIDALVESAEDIPALVAEVRRLTTCEWCGGGLCEGLCAGHCDNDE